MRDIGVVPGEKQARLFESHLLAEGIKSKVTTGAAGVTIWVLNEDQIPRAAEELRAFLAEPDAPRYRESSRMAEAAKKAEGDAERAHRKNSRDLRDRWEGPAWTKYPVTLILIAASVVVGIATSMGANTGRTFRSLIFSDYRVAIVWNGPGEMPGAVARSKGLENIRSGQVWRLVTPIFLHFGVVHLAFNMIMLKGFGGLIEFRRGSLRFLGLVMVAAVASNVGQYLDMSRSAEWGAFGGMSGVVYALFGYLWTKGYRYPEAGLGVSPNTVLTMIAWFVFCFTGAVGPVANTAHGVGLCVGMLAGLTRF